MRRFAQWYMDLPIWNVECEACWWYRGILIHLALGFLVGLVV